MGDPLLEPPSSDVQDASNAIAATNVVAMPSNRRSDLTVQTSDLLSP
jgi:hypothetical protein